MNIREILGVVSRGLQQLVEEELVSTERAEERARNIAQALVPCVEDQLMYVVVVASKDLDEHVMSTHVDGARTRAAASTQLQYLAECCALGSQEEMRKLNNCLGDERFWTLSKAQTGHEFNFKCASFNAQIDAVRVRR